MAGTVQESRNSEQNLYQLRFSTYLPWLTLQSPQIDFPSFFDFVLCFSCRLQETWSDRGFLSLYTEVELEGQIAVFTFYGWTNEAPRNPPRSLLVRTEYKFLGLWTALIHLSPHEDRLSSQWCVWSPRDLLRRYPREIPVSEEKLHWLPTNAPCLL